MEDYDRRIGRLDLVDHDVIALTCAGHALWRMDNRVPARRHIVCSQWRSVVEFDALPDLERISLAAIRRLRHRCAKVADEIGRRRGIFRVYPDQYAVKGGGGVNRRVGRLAMTVEARRRVRRNHIVQAAAAFRLLVSRRRQWQSEATQQSSVNRKSY